MTRSFETRHSLIARLKDPADQAAWEEFVVIYRPVVYRVAANIILEQGVDRLQITDFGLARAVDDASLTRTGVIAGTPEYMSPEQASGNAIDERSDLFSLGAVMYATCTGHSPFRAENSFGVLRRITDTQPRPIRDINEEVPEWLEAFILKLLAKNRDDRFESAGMAAELLKKCLAHAQHPTSISLPEDVTKLVPGQRSGIFKTVGWIGAAAALVVTAILFAQSFWSGGSGVKLAEPSKVRGGAAVGSENGPPPIDAAILQANQAEQVAQMRSEHFLPATTDVWFSVSDVKQLEKRFSATQLGELFDSDQFQPFLKRFDEQGIDWLTKHELNLGTDLLAKTDWISDEICWAFSWTPFMHGATDYHIKQALIVGVSDSKQAAEKWLAESHAAAVAQGSLKAEFEITGQKVVRIERPQNAGGAVEFYTMSDEWLFATNDVAQIRELVAKSVNKNLVAPDALSRRVSFKTAMDRSFIPGIDSQIRWFVDPVASWRIVFQLFGEQQNAKQFEENLANYQRVGFDVFTGVGGNFCFDSLENDMLHRMFICTSIHGDEESKQRQRSVLGLLNFDNKNIVPLHPPEWVPRNSASCFVANWSPDSFYANVGSIYDGFLVEPGAFKRIVNDFKVDPDMQLDVGRFVKSFDHRFIHYAYLLNPGSTNQEQEVWGFKIKRDPESVMKAVKRIDGSGRFTTITAEGYEIFENKESEDEIGWHIPGDVDDDVSYYEKRAYANIDWNLIIAKDVEAMLPIISEKKKGVLADCDDYKQVYSSLEKLTNEKNISFRQFARLDQTIKASYELLREGKLVWSDLSWFLRNYDLDDKTLVPNKMELDGSKLPADYHKHAAPFLGASGWVMETEQGGWRVTGCILKK